MSDREPGWKAQDLVTFSVSSLGVLGDTTGLTVTKPSAWPIEGMVLGKRLKLEIDN